MIGKSISRKVMAGYIVILVTVLLAGLYLYQQSSYVGRTNEAFTKELLPQLQSIEVISKELSELQLATYALYGTTISAEQFSQFYATSKRTLTQQLSQFYLRSIGLQLTFLKHFFRQQRESLSL